jgi:hypothetical protein
VPLKRNHCVAREPDVTLRSAYTLDARLRRHIDSYISRRIGSLHQPLPQRRYRVIAAPIGRRFLLKSTGVFTATLPFAPFAPFARLTGARAAEAELIARRALFDNAD